MRNEKGTYAESDAGVQITSEMVDAGIAAHLEYDFNDPLEDVVRHVYRQMAARAPRRAADPIPR